jgi:PEP-CTERM/exosortase A-associated glycosyltransferase
VVRILHLLDHSLPLQSGYSFRTVGILTAQRKRGWETVQMTTPKQYCFEGAVDSVDGWRFYRTPHPAGLTQKLPLLRELAQMNNTRRRLNEVIEETRPDVLQVHSPVLNGLPGLQAARRHGLPMVYEVRSLWEDAAVDWGYAREGDLRYRSTRNLETFVLRRADAVTTICNGLRSDILARGLPAGRVTVVPNAVDAEVFGAPRQPDKALQQALGLDDCIVLGFIGSFYAYEGLNLLMEAAAQFFGQRRGVKLLLVGGGPEKERLVCQAERLGIADRVVFTGRVPHHEVRRFYDLVTLFVYPRHRMRLTDLVTPLKPLEAMAQGAIVVASDVGGHRELLIDGETGYLFRAGDAKALARKLLEVIDQQMEWPAMRAAGRRYVETERTWDAAVARYAPVYDGLLNGKGRP